jgi:hypothetical protein
MGLRTEILKLSTDAKVHLEQSMICGRAVSRELLTPPDQHTMLVCPQAQPALADRHGSREGDYVLRGNAYAVARVIPYERKSGSMMHRTTIAGAEPVT